MTNEMVEQCEKLHKKDEHQEIIQLISEIPEKERSYQLTGILARAYNNDDQYEEAVRLLLSVQEEGQYDALWHFRLGYAYYYLGELEESKKEFEFVLESDPENEDAQMFLEWCISELEDVGGLGEETGNDFNYCPELYTEEEIIAVEAHISEYFGDFPNVFHELLSPDIHVDIAVIPPTPEKNFYTFVTMGMGAHRMTVPKELEKYQLERAELLINMPADWNISSNDEKDYWPLRWLKIMARLPGEQETWLGWGHTVPAGEPFAENTKLECMILVSPVPFKNGAEKCILPDGDVILFYQMIPIYEEEMNFKLDNDAEELLQMFDDDMFEYVKIDRKNVCEGR